MAIALHFHIVCTEKNVPLITLSNQLMFIIICKTNAQLQSILKKIFIKSLESDLSFHS